MTTILGIESTAHTFGIGVVRDGKVLSNVKSSYTTESGGIIPMDAAKHHKEVGVEVYAESLEKAGISEGEIDAIAFSQGPGLAPCLIQGINFAKELSKKFEKPLVPVNHCIAHLEIGRTTGAKNPVMLYASGANTQVIAYASGKFRVFGETLDIGVGNFIDNFARHVGIGFPGGPEIEKLAKQGKNFIELPYSVKGMDISLSGILTNLKQKFDKIKNLRSPSAHSEGHQVSPYTTPSFNLRSPSAHGINGFETAFGQVSPQGKNIKQKSSSKVNLLLKKSECSDGKIVNYTLADLSYSLQETVFAMLVETAERALAHTGKEELLLGGGVACNSRLQEMCRIMCKERGAKFFCPERSLLVDNAAMIAFLGEIIFKMRRNGRARPPAQDLADLDIKPRQRTDDVEVDWR